jgi:HlyD family secretion protein
MMSLVAALMRNYLKFVAILLASLWLTACHHKQYHYQGYVEGELIYLSSSQSGQLMQLYVHRGETVKAKQAVFQIDQQPYQSRMRQAQANLQQAQYNLQDLQLGERQTKLAAIEAQIAGAKAKLTYNQLQYQRSQYLVKTHAEQQQQLDLAEQDIKVAYARLRQLQENLADAKSAARINRIKAAAASLQAAQAALAESKWTLGQTLVTSPQGGIIFDTYYWAGEQVPAQQAVASLLTPDHVKVIFFVPEPALSHIHLNQAVMIQTNHAKQSAVAHIRYISPNAEYTPPVIYSRQTSAKLIYRVEAYFSKAQALTWHPGQPVNVTLQ